MRHIYELLTIWPGGEYVHMRTEDLHVISARYNRCRAQDVAIRIRKDGTILPIREADELCGEKWPIVPHVVRRKKRVYGGPKPNIKRKAVAEIDQNGNIVRVFESAEKMADAIGICWSSAGVWARSGTVRGTGCSYRYLVDMDER